jgi:5-amino-6-(5-phosphoribosylamino)uracil reductase
VIDTPYVTLSCAVSLDGYLDTARPPRLALSNAADFDRVDEVRAASDAILVGARTVRLDNPRLLVRSVERQGRRAESGLGLSPWKVTVTASGDLDPLAAFFTEGDTAKLVYCPRGAERRLRRRLGDDLVDELQLAVAPLFVGDRRAPRFVGDGLFPWTGERRAALVDARTIGDVVLLRYALSSRFTDDEASGLTMAADAARAGVRR